MYRLIYVAAIALFAACNAPQDELPEYCFAYFAGNTIDSISGEILPNMPLTHNTFNTHFSNEMGHFVVKTGAPVCEHYDVQNQTVLVSASQGRYFTRFSFDRNLLTEDDTVNIDIPFMRGSIVKLVFLDTSGLSLRCFDYYDYGRNRNIGVMVPSLADTTRYIYTYPDHPTMIRWYSISSSITSGGVSIPLDENSTPNNYTIYGDTIVSVGLDDTVQINCFY